VFFTYSGWNSAAYLAGELRDPQRDLTRGLVAGTLGVSVIYLALNLVVLLAVAPETLAGSTTAVAQAARALVGPRAEAWLALCVAVTVLGAANVTLMAGARIYWAMARDGLLPQPLARTNAAGVPAVALAGSGLWTALLALRRRGAPARMVHARDPAAVLARGHRAVRPARPRSGERCVPLPRLPDPSRGIPRGVARDRGSERVARAPAFGARRRARRGRHPRLGLHPASVAACQLADTALDCEHKGLWAEEERA
jgi:hypothetical protein